MSDTRGEPTAEQLTGPDANDCVWGIDVARPDTGERGQQLSGFIDDPDATTLPDPGETAVPRKQRQIRDGVVLK